MYGMIANVMNIWGELIGILVGGGILLVFGWLLALMSRTPQTPPGARGPRPPAGQDRPETIEPDGFVDSFAGVIEESGGGLPLLAIITVIGIPLWWFVYILINWSPQILSMITFRNSQLP
jgi:hypothetical protein